MTDEERENSELMNDAELWAILRERRQPSRKMVALEDLDDVIAEMVAERGTEEPE